MQSPSHCLCVHEQTQVAPDWNKAHLRLAAVCNELGEQAEAVAVLQAGLCTLHADADKVRCAMSMNIHQPDANARE